MEIRNLKVSNEKIKYNEEMKNYTSFKIGGPAECLIKVTSEEELKEVVRYCKENKTPLTILGNGSNVLVSDDGIKGITIIIKIEKLEIKKQEDGKVNIKVGAGEKLGKIARKFLEEDITGFEELSGIPGTIGGAIRMNAGAHGKEMKDIVKNIKLIDYNGIEKTLTNEQMKFEYRTSILKEEKYVVTEVELELEKGNKEEIKKKMEEYLNFRKEKQPIEYPSAGSTFKRGTDFITAKLIDEAGLKGYAIGDAQISTKHAGFVVNKGNATAKNVMELVDYVKKVVYERFNKEIELEIELIGE
ncbi:MAG: UDP-N-acetylmuramate dehydrogenase [Clostridia bacterium]|nr:UDP-N-acetylmuramate dehydrogenase [Clostridia bacterium]